MEDAFELMNVVTVGGNAVSAFLSWRLQATNACDVTLVWKSGFDHVAQYGISFKSVQSPSIRPSAQRIPSSSPSLLVRAADPGHCTQILRVWK